MRFQLQAAQHIGDLAPELPRMQRMPPDFRQRIGQCLGLVLAQYRRHFRLAAGHDHDVPGLFLQRETDRVVGGGVAGVQGGDHVDGRGQFVGGDGFGHRQIQEGHAAKAQALGQFFRRFHQLFAGFDAVDVRALPLRLGLFLEEQVIQDEAQVRLARAVVGQGDGAALRLHVFQQRFDELEQVVDLLELAAAVLVHLAVAGQDVQGLEQFDRLAGADVVVFFRHGARQCAPLGAGRGGRRKVAV